MLVHDRFSGFPPLAGLRRLGSLPLHRLKIAVDPAALARHGDASPGSAGCLADETAVFTARSHNRDEAAHIQIRGSKAQEGTFAGRTRK
jgi:hypothetical protein